ncbi:fumarylacetoacetate hydrolase family protein [Isoptericola sp. AK164]|nr:fumarylacetoacetate hydrolase family protein [Isoptericola sp. AK164]
MQDSSTPHMVFGVGVFRNPPVGLHEGDEVAVEIEGIGRLANRVRLVP